MLGGVCESHHCIIVHTGEWRSSQPCRDHNAVVQMVVHWEASPHLWHLYSLIVQKHYASVFPHSPLPFLSVGVSHARLPTPPQAQRDLLVLTVPAPQGSRVACWVPHFSKIIPATAVGLPQECFLTTASVTGTNRKQRQGERRKRRSYQVIRNGSA